MKIQKSIFLLILITIFFGCDSKNNTKIDSNTMILEETPSNYLFLINQNLTYAKEIGYKWGIKDSMNVNKKAEIVMKKVSSIPYEEYSPGAKSPQKTVKDNLGDCEDKSILAASILKSFNINTILVDRKPFIINGKKFKGHVYLGLILNEKSQNKNFKCNGRYFIPFDATKNGSKIGNIDDYYKIDELVRISEVCYSL